MGGTLETNFAWGNLNANVNVSMIGRYNRYAEEENVGEKFRFSPEVSSNLSYSFPKWGTNISLYYEFTGERAEYYMGSDNSNKEVVYLQTMPSYNYADITLSQKLMSFLNLNFGVRNLFNITSLQVRADRSDIGVMPLSHIGCGRSWFVGLNINLDGKFKKKK